MVIVDTSCPPRMSWLAGPDRLDRQRAAVDGGAGERIDDALCLGRRDLDEREALEDPDVADRLAVEPAAGGGRRDQLAGLETGRASGVGDQLGVAGAVRAVGVVRLPVPPRLLGHLRGADVGALRPR